MKETELLLGLVNKGQSELKESCEIPPTVSRWAMAAIGVRREGEGLISDCKRCGAQRPLPPW
jgi:hypothetical protein